MHVLGAVVVLGCRIYVFIDVIASSRHVRPSQEGSQQIFRVHSIAVASNSCWDSLPAIAWRQPINDKDYCMYMYLNSPVRREALFESERGIFTWRLQTPPATSSPML